MTYKLAKAYDEYKGRNMDMGIPTFKYIRIYFGTPTFDRVIKDIAAKPVDKLSAIGGTMGLLTGFSIISDVEIIYFSVRIVLGLFQPSQRN